MNLEKVLNDLVKMGKLKKQSTDVTHINSLLEAAHRNFEAALLVKDRVDEAAFKLTYDGMLQIGRAVLLLNGYRPDDGEQHKTTFHVAGLFLGEQFQDLISKIQRFRVKRNNCVYDPVGLISKKETESIVKIAQEFQNKVAAYLKEKDPQLRLFGI